MYFSPIHSFNSKSRFRTNKQFRGKSILTQTKNRDSVCLTWLVCLLQREINVVFAEDKNLTSGKPLFVT